MTVPEDAWVFDTGPLRHFTAQGWLGVLRFLADGRPVFIPDSVERELVEAAKHVSAVHGALEADWIHVHRSSSPEYIAAFAHYRDRMVANGKNLGECGVLAMGQVYDCEVVIDDAVPRQIAQEKKIRVLATVPLLCTAIREKKLHHSNGRGAGRHSPAKRLLPAFRRRRIPSARIGERSARLRRAVTRLARLSLAVRAEVGRAVHEVLAHDLRAAAGAGLALLAVDRE